MQVGQDVVMEKLREHALPCRRARWSADGPPIRSLQRRLVEPRGYEEGDVGRLRPGEPCSGALLDHAEMSGIYLSNADLRGASLVGADCRGLILRRLSSQLPI